MWWRRKKPFDWFSDHLVAKARAFDAKLDTLPNWLALMI
jgi:hypothetical protein